MSIASEIQKLQVNVENIYDKIEEKGGTIPSQKTLANVPDAIDTVSGDGNIMDETLILTPDKETSETIEPQYDEYTAPYTDEQGIEYDGVKNIKVRKIGSWIDSQINADNIREGHTILGVAGHVVELKPTTLTVSPSTRSQTITPTDGKNGFTEVTVNAITLQNKSVTPKSYSQTVGYDSGYNGLNTVSVDKVTSSVDSNIKAENIKKDISILGVTGTYQPTFTTEEKTVNPQTYTQYVTPSATIDGLTKVTVNPVTASIDSDIVAGNIKKDVNILGVTGTYDGDLENVNATSTIEPMITEQTFTPSAGHGGFHGFKVNPVTSDIDANIKASNIKKNVEILGVMGTYVTEKLQDKVVSPKTSQQVVTYDDDNYEGLNTVTITAVDSTIDSNILAENIKKDVSILGVTGTLEEGTDPVLEEKTVSPSTSSQSIVASEGYDGLSKVNIEGVTASIDANILAENIKKNISILGVTGSLEATEYNMQSGKEVQPALVDRTYTPDAGYDALLNIIVKAVTASIDPNILPKNIKEGITILGVTGELVEGQAQKWIEYKDIQGITNLSEHCLGGGSFDTTDKDNIDASTTYDITPNVYNIDGLNGTKISAAVFSMILNYDNLEATDTKLEQTFIYFFNGKYYDSNFNLTSIPDQISYIYPVSNDWEVNGCLLNSDDVATAKEYGLYVLINSESNANKPVLVDGTFDASMYPEGYDTNRYVGKITIPAHNRFEPKGTEDGIQWVLRDRKGVENIIIEHDNKPLTVDVSAHDKDYGEEETIEERTFTNYNVIGSPTISSEYIASGFTTIDNYIKTKNTYDFSGSWGVMFKAKFSTLSGYQHFFKIGNSQGDVNLLVGMYNAYPAFWISSNGSSWNIANTSYSSSISANVEYYFNIWFNGSSYAIDVSTNGSSWSRMVTINNTTKIYRKNTNLLFGSAWTDSPSQYMTLKLNEIGIQDASGYYRLINSKTVSSHDIIPLTRDLLFYDRNVELSAEYGNYGNLLNYDDTGVAVNMPLYNVTVPSSQIIFEQPNLTANGSLGGSSFACDQSGYYSTNTFAYAVFDFNSTDTNHRWQVNSVSTSSYQWIKWYNPEKITIEKLTITDAEAPYRMGNYVLSGSNDNETWVELKRGTNTNTTAYSSWEMNVESTTGYKYFKLECLPISSTAIEVYKVKIHGYTTIDSTRTYIFSPNNSFVDGVNYKDEIFVDTVSIPEHDVFIWNNTKQKFEIEKRITLSVDDDSTVIYTEIEEAE